MTNTQTPAHDDREYVSVPETMRLTGLGRTTIYYLIGQETIESRKVGKRRLVVRSSIGRLGLAGQTANSDSLEANRHGR
jgi:predicted DNA-binding transcriptional regulator AlpA